MAKARGFTYNKRSREDLQERANARSGNFDSIFKDKYNVYKVRDGKNLIRILPPTWDKAKHYGYDIWVNYKIGADKQSYLSLSQMLNEKDPLDEARREAEREGKKDFAKALKPRKRVLLWLIDRNDEDEGPQLWAAPFSFDKDLANLSFDEDTKDMVLIDDPDEGRDVRFYKEGQGLNTEYPSSKIRLLNAAPIHTDEGLQNEWLQYIQDNPLPDCLQFYDYDHIANAFDGNVMVDDEDEAPKPKAKPAAAPVDDDNEEPPFEADPPKAKARPRVVDDEPEQPPRRRVAKPDPEDEDEEPETVATKPTQSIRERLQGMRRRPATQPDED